MVFQKLRAFKKSIILLSSSFAVMASCSRTGVVTNSKLIQAPKKAGISFNQNDSPQIAEDFTCKIEVSESDAKRIHTSLSNLLSFGSASFDFMIDGRQNPIATVQSKLGSFSASYKLGTSGIEKKTDKIYCRPKLNYKTLSVDVDSTTPVQIGDSAPFLELKSGTLLQTSLVANTPFASIVFSASDADNDSIIFVAQHSCGGSIQTVTSGSTLTVSGTMPNLATCSIEVFAKADGVLSTSHSISLLQQTNVATPIAVISNAPITPSSNTTLNINVSGTDVTEYKYALKSNWQACSLTDNFSAQWISIATPISGSLSSTGEYRICVIGRDAKGVAQTAQNASSKSWVYTTSNFPLASMSNPPASASNSDSLNVAVNGPGIAAYQYAVITAGSCAAATYNGTWIPSATPITSTLGADGNYTLCIRGRDADGTYIQQAADATSYSWQKDTTPPVAAGISMSGSPASPSSTAALDVTVGGTDVVSYRYALITQATPCSAALFSTNPILVATHITETLGADGNLRLCIVGLDSVGNETAASAAKVYDWTKDSSSVTASLSGAPSTVSNATSLNVTVSGTGVVNYKYAVITVGTCNAATYSASWTDIATPITEALGADGSYTLCVIGQNASSTAQLASAATTSNWTKDTVAPTTAEIQLAGTPSQPSNAIALDVTVSGTSVVTYKYALVAQSTACSAATYSASWIAIATHITDTLGGDGPLRLCVRGRDSAGNSTIAANAKQFDWTKNTAAAVASIANQPATSSSATSLNVTVSGTNIDSYKFAVITSGTCAAATYNASWIAVATAITSALGPDGNYTLCVIGKNTAGTQQTAGSATSYAWNKDTVAPVVASLNLSGTPVSPSNATSLNVNISGSDAVSYKYAITTQATSCAAATYSASWIAIATAITDTLGADGNLRLCVIAQDAATNAVVAASAKQFDWTKNTAAATASLTGALNGTSASTSLNVTVGGTNIVSYQYALITSGSCDVATYNASWILISTPITDTIGSDGSKTLCVIGKNDTGTQQVVNSATSASWTKDTTAPTAAEILLSGTPANPSNAGTLNISVSGTGVTHYKSAVTDQTTACSAASYSASWKAIATPITDSLGSDGNYRLCVIAQDIVGNATAVASAKQYDRTKNTAAVGATLSGEPTGQSNAASLNVTVAGTDVVSYKYSIITSGNCTSATYSGSWIAVSTHITDALGADDNYTLCVIGRNSINTDQAVASATTASWTKDATAPTSAEITLSGTPSNPSSSTTLNVTVSGTGVVSYKYALTTNATSCAAATYSATWIAVATHITDSIGSDGNLRLCVIGQDSAGNGTAVGSAKQFDWTKDTIAPTAGDITLSGTPTTPSSSTSINVTVSGVTNYKYSLTTQATSCSAATYSASWIAIATHITDTLGSDGNLRLCVIGQDAAGNSTIASNAKSFDWLKDTVAPLASDITLSGTPSDPSNATALNVTVSGTDIIAYQFAITTDATACSAASYNGSWIAVATAITASTGTDANKKRLCVIAQDSASNATATANAKSFDWKKDTVVPTSAVTTLSGTPSSTSTAENIDVSVGGTDIAYYKYSIITSGGCAAATYSASWVAVATHITESLGTDNNYTLCVIGRDTALNDQLVSDATSYAWVKDTAKPVAADITLGGTPADPSNGTALDVTVGGTGVISYQYALTTSATACTVATYNGSWVLIATHITASIGVDADKKRLCVIAKDLAGNEMVGATDAAKTADWKQDTVKPTAAEITLTGTPADPSNTLTLSITVGGTGVSFYKYALTTSATACTAATYNASWVAVATTITDSIGADANKKRLCVIAKDAAGNAMVGASDAAKSYDWVQDSLTPTAADITLTGTPSDPSNVASLSVSVSGSEISFYQYALTTDATSCTAATYNGTWIAIATSITASVGADANKKRLCVIAKDAASNAMATTDVAKSYDWKLDRTGPTAAEITLTNTPSAADYFLNVTVGGTDVVSYRYKVDLDSNISCSGTSGFSEWRSLDAPITDKIGAPSNKGLCVQAKDSLGNFGTTTTYSKAFQWTKEGSVELSVWDYKSGQITLSWNPIDSASDYFIYWSTSPGVTTSSTKISLTTQTSYIHTGRTNNTTYYYRASYVVGGIESNLGVEVSAKPTSTLVASGPICTNNTVQASATDSSSGNTYLAGTFTYLGKCTGGAIQTDTITAGALAVSRNTFASINGDVYAIDGDDIGGFYVGGSFSTVGGYTRNNLVHILQDGSVDPAFNPDVTGTVYAITKFGTSVYIGGSFTAVGGTTRNRLAAIDWSTGALKTWDPNSNGTVYTIQASTDIYVGGAFTTIGGTARNRLASLTTAGVLQSWNPNANNTVYSISINGTNVYIGGQFTNIVSTARSYVAAVSTAGTLQSWNPGTNGTVYAVNSFSTSVYLGGDFTTAASTARNHVALVDTSAVLQSWNPGTDGTVYSILISNAIAYLGGNFTTAGGSSRTNAAAIHFTSAALQTWNPSPYGTVRAISWISNSEMYIGGQFRFVGGSSRSGTATVNSAGGLLSGWDMAINGTVNAMVVSGTNVYLGGQFTTVGGTARNYLAAVNTSGTLQSWNPNANAAVNDLTVSGSNVYIGGDFTTIGGTARNYLAAVSTAGVLQTWNPNANASVSVVRVAGTNVYTGGDFTTIGGTARNRVAAISTADVLQSWDPNIPSGHVYSLAIDNSIVYIGGSFTTVAGQTRSKAAAVNTSGVLQSWNPNLNSTVNSLAVLNSVIYMAGSFTTIGGTTRNYLGAYTAAGAIHHWNPDSNEAVSSLSIANSNICIIGGFETINGEVQQNFGMTDANGNSIN